MVWLVPSVLSRRMHTRSTMASCREKVVRKLERLRVGCDSKRNNIYQHHKLVLSLSGIKIETFSPGDLSTPGFTPPITSSAPTTPTKGNAISELRLHNNGGNNENHSSRSESTPPRPAYSLVKDDPYGIEEACMERKLSQPDDEGTEEITLGINPNVPEGNCSLENGEAALQDALRKVADLQALNAQHLKSLMTTRGIAHDAEDQVRKLRGNLSKAKNSIETLESWLEERNTELEGLDKDKIFLEIQLEQCEAEYDKLRKLARDIWIRMSDLEVVLAKDYGVMLDEEDDVQRYGDLRTRAMERINIPRVYMDVLADLTSKIENEGKINGADRIIDEVSDNEETIIKRYPLLDDRNAVVVWTEPPFLLNKLSDLCLGVETSTALNREQSPEPDVRALPAHNSSSLSISFNSELSDGKSSASSEEQEEPTTVLDTGKESSIDLNAIDVAISLNEAPLKQLRESPPSAAEQLVRPPSSQASDAERVKEKAAQIHSLIVGKQQEAPSQAVEKNAIHYPSSVDDTSANTDRGFQKGTKPEKLKITKAQRREAAMKRDAEAVAKKKAEEEARVANVKKWKKSKKGLRK